MIATHRGGPRRLLGTLVVAALCVSLGATTVQAKGRNKKSFDHIATFDVTSNGTEVAEIVDSTVNGKGLAYTDSDTESLGFVDIRDPSDPKPDGTLALGGEPTSVAVRGPRYALVGINTSPGDEDDEPPVRSGALAIVDLKARAVARTIDPGGQLELLIQIIMIY